MAAERTSTNVSQEGNDPDVDHTLRMLDQLVMEDDSCRLKGEKLAASSGTTKKSAIASPCAVRAPPPCREETMDMYEDEPRMAKRCSLLKILEQAAAANPDDEEEHCCEGESTTNKTLTASLPGAHRVQPMDCANLRDSQSSIAYDAIELGIGGTDLKNNPDKDLQDNQARSSWASTQACSSTFSLAVANPVDEDAHSLGDLPRAQLDVAKERSAGRKWPLCLALALASLMAIGILLALTLALVNTNKSGTANATISNGTMTPTSMYTVESHALSLLPSETIYYLQEQGSPQARAFDWLLHDMQQNPDFEDSQILQRYALATLFYSTRGEHWLANEHWLSHDQHECQWYNQQQFKMKCTLWKHYKGDRSHFFPQFAPGLARCNDQGQYQNLWLDANNLVGPIPDELYLLSSLKTLSLVNNQLVGPLSSHIGQLSNLEGLFSFGMTQGGQIPSEIGLLSNLRGLGLLTNEHTGTIPSELWSLTKLETVALGGNAFLGSIPSALGSMPNLKWFCVFQGQLTGTIPTEVGLLSNLEMMDLEGNNLEGQLPTELGLLSNMKMLSLLDASLTGSIPAQGVAGLGQVTLLNLGQNSFTGTLPKEIATSMTNLEILDVSQNPNLSVDSSVQSEIELLPNLVDFTL